ncbi:arginine and glutamate-rich protein 1-like [Linepithema humile]|uniref:arginine and glutamate-rich protein 1-like n=1 Tax=Linepithema humile TaxID=83485 RepID=UPI00351F041C
MVRPSHPRLMARVLDALINLGDTKGSSAREVLSFIRQSNVSAKNLTVQVHRALKHALAAGLLRHRSGRYKVLATLNPVSVSDPSTSKKPVSNDPKTEEKKINPDAQAPIGDAKSRRTQERKRKTTSRRRSSKRRSSNTKRKSRARSPYKKRSTVTVQNRKRRQRKRAYEDEEFESQSPEQYVLHRRDGESSAPFNRRAKRSRVSKRELESDLSDESECESDMNRKHLFRASKSQRRRRKVEVRAKSRNRSASRARSSQLLQRTVQARQHAAEKIENDREQQDEDHGSVERSEEHRETHEDVEGACEANNSNSGSTLENS